ncbi:MAG: TIGR00289 family protein [Methanobacteriaceae archaeon]|nr:TIGR00289 family protein [Methanobacteriaceae archaeon]
MDAAVLYSGGKDSTMALYRAMKNDNVKYLVSMVSDNPYSYMFHVPNIRWTRLSSKAIGIPLIEGSTSGVKEEELKDLKRLLKVLKERGVKVLYSGAIASSYQRSRIEKLCQEVGLIPKTPLWHVNPLKYMIEILNLGFEVIVTAVAAEGFDSSWLGRRIDQRMLTELKNLNKEYGVHLAFEGGEAETFVLDGPIFKKRIKILNAKKRWSRDSGVLEIRDAILVDKD